MPQRAATEAVTASIPDSLRVVGKVLTPTLVKGIIVRIPTTVKLAEKAQLDSRAVATLSWLRARYGRGPLRLRIPGRTIALLLDPGDAEYMLAHSGEPFAPATVEKRAALRHFQPHGVLASRGDARDDRREFNEAALNTHQHIHGVAPSIVEVIGREIDQLLDNTDRTEQLDWDDFVACWWRIIRQVVLGRAARDDHQLTDELTRLRSRANWPFLLPRNNKLLRSVHDRLNGHLDRAEMGSVAEVIAAEADPNLHAPTDQVAHWLFAFDPAAIATFRTLALLATHPEQESAARAELADTDLSQPQPLWRLRASMLDSLRLWPTTPVILRQSTTPTTWGGQELPAGTTLGVFAPFFHRDSATLDIAHRFAPEVWLDGGERRDLALVPFSSGPAQCPGQNLVLLVASTTLAMLLKNHRYALHSHPPLGPTVPATLDHFRLRFSSTRIH